ncbi:MAG: hypothetical protein AVDCRST_MAG13-3705, partial [uncultured Solirubrobacteraceae bacterium]
GAQPTVHDRRAAQVRGAGIPQGLRQRGHHVDGRQHPRPLRRRCPGLLPQVGPGERQGGDRAALRRRRRDAEVHPPRLRRVHVAHDRDGHLRGRGHELRRAPGRDLAGGRHALGPLVRRLRGARLPDPALLHLPRPGLRGPGHRPLRVARRRGARRRGADRL